MKINAFVISITVVIAATIIIAFNTLDVRKKKVGPHQVPTTGYTVDYFHTYDSVTGKCIKVDGRLNTTTYTVEPMDACKKANILIPPDTQISPDR